MTSNHLAAATWRPRSCFDDPAVLGETLTRRVLPLVSAPGRYIGGELGTDRAGFDPAGANILLTFPDAYEVGMSHQGLRILYTLLQAVPGVFCDLAYAPWRDMETVMRAEGLPLFGLESRRPATAFDLVGFSLGYELAYTNMLNMIDLSGAALHAAERQDTDPIFIAGGSCTMNPTVVGPFLDVVFLGDGEEIMVEAANLVRKAKGGGAGRPEILAGLRDLPGAWWTGCPGPVRVRTISDMNAYPPPGPLVPVIEPVHDRLALEVMRGCVRGCRFCQAGMITRPVRERDAEKLVDAARQGVAATGYTEVSLLSLSTADYTGLKDTVGGIQEDLTGSHTNLALPSLRVDAVDEELFGRIHSERPKSFTFAPEAGSQRLRDVINKNITEDQILQTAREAFASGIKSVKLYFMIGLPTETNEDLDELIALVGKVVALAPRGGAQVHVSLSPFAPKSHTPFQWAGQISREEITRRNNYLARPLRRMKAKVSLREPEVSYLEGLLGLGDEAVSGVVAEAWRRGARFDGWDECFDFSIWEGAIAAVGIDPAVYLDPRDPQMPLPWDSVDVGLKKGFLLRDWERACRERTIPDCRLEAGCYDCGPCGQTLQHLFSQTGARNTVRPPRGTGGPAEPPVDSRIDDDAPAAGPDSPAFDVRNADPAEPGRELRKWTIWRQQAAAKCWYRMEYAKTGDMAYLGHLDFQRQLQFGLRRSGLPVAYSKGYHPHPLLKFGPPLPVGTEGLAECLDLALTHACPGWEDVLDAALPEGLTVRRQAMVGSQTPVSIDKQVTRFSYLVSLPAAAAGGPTRSQVAAPVEAFTAAEVWPHVRRRPKGDLELDLKQLVPAGALALVPENEEDPGRAVKLQLSLHRSETGAILPVQEFLAALLGDLLPEVRYARVTRTGYHGLHRDGRWLSPLEEVGEMNLRYWLGRRFLG